MWCSRVGSIGQTPGDSDTEKYYVRIPTMGQDWMSDSSVYSIVRIA